MTRNYLDILTEAIRNNWDQPALTDLHFATDGYTPDLSRGNHYTYGELYNAVVDVANILFNNGLRKGDHIAICGENSSNWIVAYLAITKLQAVAVVVMPILPTAQIVQLINFSDAKALFADANIRTKLQGLSLPQLKSVVGIETLKIDEGQSFCAGTPYFTASEIGFGEIDSDDPAMICFTSGSTENPKAVLLANRTISSNVEFLTNMLPGYENQHAFIFLTMSHVLGQLLLTSFYLGCHTFVLREALTPALLEHAIEYVKPYLLVLVPMLATKLMEQSMGSAFPYVKYFLVGGAQVPQEFINVLQQRMIPISIGYGQTETGAMTSLSAPDKFRNGSVGTVSKTTQITIAPNGEILVKGENVMLGYYKDPEATARKIDKDGWLHTGDKGYLDEDGYLYVEGRLENDMIVLPNGENIHPEDIERKINALPEVKESIVLARDGKLVAIVVAGTDVRRHIFSTINPLLPLYSQIYDVEITDVPLQKTEKQTLKRYLYK